MLERAFTPALALVTAGLVAVCLILGSRPHGTVVAERVEGPSLTGNRLGTSTTRDVLIYLPPGYRDSDRRYPTLYLLHGHDATPAMWLGRERAADLHVPHLMDSLIDAGAIQPMIVVMPDARDAIGGAFYTDSSVAGGWETFVTSDLVAYVDARYRTLDRAVSRGIAGHSMGGYGALRLAIRHPDVFGAAYGMSPLGAALIEPHNSALLAADLRREVLTAPSLESLESIDAPSPNARLLAALGVAWSPAPSRAPLPLDPPFSDGSAPLEPGEPLRRWRANTLMGMIPAHIGGLRRLRALAFDAGDDDAFTSIPIDCRALATTLDLARVRYTYTPYRGGHTERLAERLRRAVLPLMSQRLVHPSQD